MGKSYAVAEPHTRVVANFGTSGAGGVLGAAPVFLSEDSAALLVRDRVRVSEVLVFRLAEGDLRRLAKTGTLPNQLLDGKPHKLSLKTPGKCYQLWAPQRLECPRPTTYQGVLDPINLTQFSRWVGPGLCHGL